MDPRKRTVITRTFHVALIRAAWQKIQSGESFLDKYGVVPLSPSFTVIGANTFETFIQMSLSNQYRQNIKVATDTLLLGDIENKCPAMWKGILSAYREGFDTL